MSHFKLLHFHMSAVIVTLLAFAAERHASAPAAPDAATVYRHLLPAEPTAANLPQRRAAAE